MKKLFATTIVGLALAATVSACGSSSSSSSTAAASASSTMSSTAAPSAGAGKENIVQTAVAAGSFNTLASLVKQAGLVGALSGPGPLTVFAPTDAAFAMVPKATLDELAKNKAKLRAVLLYHVVKGNVTAAEVTKLKSAKTLDGKSLAIRTADGKVYVGDAQVTKPDVAATNGTIHVINRVLIPTS
ncbi:MAG: fasciclin domain-containing protein [Solirubrobacterales bacterium]|nr:fasciclin domain-containing protein [Solirubrobacterales bacterium]